MLKQIFLTATMVSALSVAVQGQSQQTLCQTDPHFRDFDFWLGEWAVENRANKAPAGQNTITSHENGCALFENWKSISGGTGFSTNHYNPITKKWRQVWLSAGAYSIDIEGGLVDGSMHLVGNIWYYSNNTSFPIRGTWTPNTDGTVRQLFEQYNPQTKKWDIWFDGLYKRKNASK